MDTITEKKRLSFDEDAANYDKWRPRYTKELFEDVIRTSEIGKGKRALEIGIGTGQATEPFLKTGCSLTAVEIGRNLSDYSKEKFKQYANLSIENLAFEDFRAEDGTFDLIYSATAFHWIPEQIGFPKAFRLLKSGGTLALWRNRPFPGKADGSLFIDIQKVYEKYRPGGGKPAAEYSSSYREKGNTILSYGFTGLDLHLYHAVRNFGAEEYVGLLNTYSDHRDMEPDKKRAFESEIMAAVRRDGNAITVFDTIGLYLSKKP